MIQDLPEYQVIKEEESPGESLVKQSETEPDMGLVNKAYDSLADIFSKHFEGAMLEAGQFIINEFYGGNIERARKNEPVKGESLHQLIQMLHNRSANAPSKSWIYNAVKLVVESEDLKDFHTYGNLLLSHKILLFPIDDIENKKKLIEETVENNYTIEELRSRIMKLKPVVQRERSLFQAIKDPETLFSEEFAPALEIDFLTRRRVPTLQRFRTMAQDKIAEIEKSIGELESLIESHKGEINRYKQFIETLHTGEATKTEGRVKKRKSQPTQTDEGPTLPSQ